MNLLRRLLRLPTCSFDPGKTCIRAGKAFSMRSLPKRTKKTNVSSSMCDGSAPGVAATTASGNCFGN